MSANTTIYYVATLARYVLVNAENETHARDLGHAALHELYADRRELAGKEVPINIVTVRSATSDEIEFWGWTQQTLAREAAMSNR